MSSQILRSRTSAAPAGPVAPNYHALATPVLHRRFVRASWTAVIVAFLSNIILGGLDRWPYSAVPFGWNIVNTVFLFASLVPTLVLRIAQLRTTPNQGPSDAHNLLYSIIDGRLARCLLWYCASASLLIIFYISEANDDSDLSLFIKPAPYLPVSVNGRFLYLMTFGFLLSLLQSIIHIWTERDILRLRSESKTFLTAFSETCLQSAQRILTSIVAAVALGPLFYWMFESVISSGAYLLFSPFKRISPEGADQSLTSKIDLFIRSAWLGLCIIVAWEVTNMSFTLEFSKGPIREGKTVSERSSDPNGSLILGLRLKKRPLSRVMAFKELAHIASSSATRRETIFKDLQKPLSTWQQISKECRDLLIEVEAALSPPPPVPPLEVNPPAVPETQDAIPDSISLVAQKPLEENVLRTPTRKTALDKWQATPQNLPVSPIKLHSIKARLVSSDALGSKLYEFANPLMRSNYGDIFRLTIQRKTALLLPHAGMQVDAINSLTDFICASLEEDVYGMVQKELPDILEGFTKTALILEIFMDNPPIHWSDLKAHQLIEEKSPLLKARLFPEASALLSALDVGVSKIGDKFSPYIDKLAVSADVRKRLRQVRETPDKS